MITHRKLGLALGSAALLFSSACADLEVTNPNNPDIDRALASPGDVQTIAENAIRQHYLSTMHYYPTLALTITADVMTANYGNFGMRFHNVEPRGEYLNNSAGGDDQWVARSAWNNNYADLGSANDVLIALGKGISLGDAATNDKYKALAVFGQAAALSNLALYFDQAFIVDETTDLTVEPELQPYSAVAAAALAKWDALIALTAGKSETYEAGIVPFADGNALTSQRLNQIANTMAARLLAYMPRNKTENAAVDWAKVLQYAQNGITKPGAEFAFNTLNDGDLWYSTHIVYADYAPWVRVDMSVINMMDPNSPAKYTGTMPPKGTSADARFESDLQYHGAVIGDPARGIYMQSPYSHKRWRYLTWSDPNPYVGEAPFIQQAENDLLIAEALIRTNGDLARAATLINKTRVTRGKLAPATAGDGAAKLLQYIDYERIIELMVGSQNTEFFNKRRNDQLQAGTYRHLPLPAAELETLGLPIYTYGGANNPDMSRSGFQTGLSLSRNRSVPGIERPEY